MKQYSTKNYINPDNCKQCRRCMEVCPCNIIGLNAAGAVSFLPERESICLSCGQCMAICSAKAIQLGTLSYGRDIIDVAEHQVNYQDFLTFISNRRSIRSFKKTAVPGEVIQKILDAVSYAPFGSAPEKVNITVINKRKTIESALPHMEAFLDKIVWWMENPVASYLIKKAKGQETFHTIKHHLYPIAKLENYKLKHGDRITREAPAILILHADRGAEEHTNNSLIYATYIMLAAHSLGLGATMVGIVPAAVNKVPAVRNIFKIPEGHEAVMSVILGYPNIKFKRAIKRNVQTIRWVD